MRTKLWLLMLLFLLCLSLANAQTRSGVTATSRQTSLTKSTGTPAAMALEDAAEQGDMAQVRRLLRQGVNVDADSNGQDHKPPLMRAAANGRTEIVRLLIAHKANVNYNDVTGYSVLITATTNGQLQITRLLLAHGANINRDWRFGSPLSCAVGKGRLPLVKLLVRSGADVNGGGAYTNVMQEAAANADVAVVRYLLKHGGRVNNAAHWNRTPLLEATNTHNTPVVALLLEHGARVAERCEVEGLGFQTGETALHLAKRNGYYDIVKLLRQAGAKR